MSRPSAPHVADRRPGPAGVVAIVVAGALQLVVGFLTLTSGLVAPLWAIGVLAVVWFAAVGLLLRLARSRALLTPLVPLGNAAVWIALLSFGGTVLGWSA